MLDEDDTTMKRKKGTMMWSGMPNLFWVSRTTSQSRHVLTCEQFIDRKAGLCGVFGTQVLPPGDKKVEEVIILFENEMYKRVGIA